MAVAINATEGGADSNSYVTLAEANAELEYVFDSEWSSATDDEKTIALVLAARKIDSFGYYGTIAYETQKMQFPRYFRETSRTATLLSGATSYIQRNDVPITPENVKTAQIHEAHEIIKMKKLLANNRTTREDLIRQGVKWVQMGENVYERYEKSYLEPFISPVAQRLMQGIIKTQVAS
jgi:hypothetical protein